MCFGWFWRKFWKKLALATLCAAPQAQCAAPVYFYTGNLSPMRRASYVCAPLALCISIFLGDFWRPSRCRNWAWNSSLEISLSLLSNPTWIFQCGVHFPCQKSNLPRLVKMCQMRLPQGRVLLQSTFEDLPQLQIELILAHWKFIGVYLSFDSTRNSFGQPS